MTIRLDKFLTNKYPCYTRNKISQFIKNKCIKVNSQTITKPGYLVSDTDKVELLINSDQIWVSRDAFKLLKALDYFKINLNNKICLDIGCSTGGFSQVMLKHGAKFVYAVDTGTNQFDKSLLGKKVKLMEQTHFCKTKPSDFEHVDFITCDVSFISATKIIEHVVKIFNYPFTFACLIKPQFELTKQILDAVKGQTIPEKYHSQAISRVCQYAKSLGLKISEVVESPILGAKSNNKEFLVCFYIRNNYEQNNISYWFGCILLWLWRNH